MNDFKFCVYTVVINHYDFIFPPFGASEATDFFLITDNPKLKVKGWKTISIDSTLSSFSASMINRYYKLFPHRFFPGYDVSIYVDGNIRIVGSLESLVNEFRSSQYHIGLLKHPLRSNVFEEVEACIRLNKVKCVTKLREEYQAYLIAGFSDTNGLTENSVILRKHNKPKLIEAMEYWWLCMEKWAGRDQISLPYVREKFQLNEKIYSFNTRVENPYFRIYPHRTNKIHLDFGIVLSAKRLTNQFYKLASKIYNLLLRIVLKD
jgi:hypothetical protein